MRKMQIKDEYKGKTVIVYNSVLGNQNVIIDKILPKHYDWYSRNGLAHVFEAEATIKPTFELTEEEVVPVVKKTRTKKK
jgi:hypothetical protein